MEGRRQRACAGGCAEGLRLTAIAYIIHMVSI